MEQFLRSALASLPSVATHPLALVAYIVVIIAWVLIAWRVKRNKNLLSHLDKLPDSDRLQALQSEMGNISLKEGLSADQYLKSRIHFYYFLGFAILCLMTVIIFVVSAVMGKEGEGTANVDVSLYDEPLNLSEGHIEEPNVLKYILGRNDERGVQINPALPYLTLHSANEEIPTYEGCKFTFPKLSIVFVNNTKRTLVLTEAVINVKSSNIISLPILGVEGGSLGQQRKLLLKNEGWGDIVKPILKLGITRAESCEKAKPDEATIMIQLPTIQTTHAVDITAYIPAELLSEIPQTAKKLASVCAFGKVSYNIEDNISRSVTFKTWVPGELFMQRPMNPSIEYRQFFEAGKSGYTIHKTLRHEIKSGDSDLFLIQIATNKWAQFNLNFSFRSIEGQSISGNDVFVNVFVPRSESDDFSQEDFEHQHPIVKGGITNNKLNRDLEKFPHIRLPHPKN